MSTGGVVGMTGSFGAGRASASPVIRMVTLTGSVAVGKELSRLAAEGVKPALMELGGHAPVLIDRGVDPAHVARLAVKALEHPIALARVGLAPCDVTHLQWVGAPDVDAWLLRTRVPLVFTGDEWGRPTRAGVGCSSITVVSAGSAPRPERRPGTRPAPELDHYERLRHERAGYPALPSSTQPDQVGQREPVIDGIARVDRIVLFGQVARHDRTAVRGNRQPDVVGPSLDPAFEP